VGWGDEIIHSLQPDPDAPADWGMRSDSSAVLAIHEDHRGDLWVGTVAGLHRLDRRSGTFTHYRHDPDTAQKMRHSLSDDEVLSILEDSAGNLWVGTVNGLDQFILSEAEGPVLSKAEGLDRSENRFLGWFPML
jgi:ligand-binding sensor domain-containing protein